jgi:hypothetical protein
MGVILASILVCSGLAAYSVRKGPEGVVAPPAVVPPAVAAPLPPPRLVGVWREPVTGGKIKLTADGVLEIQIGGNGETHVFDGLWKYSPGEQWNLLMTVRPRGATTAAELLRFHAEFSGTSELNLTNEAGRTTSYVRVE